MLDTHSVGFTTEGRRVVISLPRRAEPEYLRVSRSPSYLTPFVYPTVISYWKEMLEVMLSYMAGDFIGIGDGEAAFFGSFRLLKMVAAA